ncbi:TIGR03089 family protein [Nocardioides sp. AE5]|uniref:TIGR03089 family protein n=1 Tax=Nocardioides sp. AE5 TaxID=2962573 RepID=UPI002881B241|nr:TIGR03089 family protein [Nocardioides sp. AE5]MDT0201895.1 TIGR03089 family protein [Nocardioides sp. AE5]
MAATFPDLLSSLLAADPGRPLVTFYDDATGERVELSVATWANWVAKTSSLLVEEFDLERGDRVLIDLPTHWLGPVFLGAAWNAGLAVTFDGSDAAADAVICGPATVVTYADRGGSAPVLATALLPLGVRFADPLPAGVHDFGVEVWGQPDSFLPWDPPQADDLALLAGPDGPAATTQAELVTPATGEAWDLVAGGGRLLTTANPASPTGLATFVAPLVSGGSTVWVAHADPDSLERKYAAEQATGQLH